MQAKLFMIPWLVGLVASQPVAAPAPPPPAQVLTNDLVDAHRRHFLEMIRRQQQINDALLLNNALLHPHPLPALHIPANPTEQLLPPPLFNPFIPSQNANQGSTSKLGTYGKDEDVVESSGASSKSAEEKEGTVVAPQRPDIVKKTLAGVKTVSIQKKQNMETEAPKPLEEAPTTTTISPEDLEVVQLFKKLNLSKEETKSIVERVEQVVREKLMSKKLEEEEEVTTTTVSTTKATTPSITTITTTEAPTTTTKPTTIITTEATTTTETTEEFVEGGQQEEEDYSLASTSEAPRMHIRSEDNLVHLQRNNLKHHPIRIQEKKIQEALESEEVSQGSIKTSLTHLPIFVANEEEDAATQNQKASLHKRILIASQDKEKENERDLLVDFATGAPLDLTEQEVTKSKPEVLPVATSPVYSSLQSARVTSQPIAPPRLNYHERTDFERLASDYRRRLEHTGDINKILQKISENAYISLVERGGRRKLFGN